MNLILIDSAEVSSKREIYLEDARALHIRNVLRAQPGDTVRVGILNGPMYQAVLLKQDTAGVCLSLPESSISPPPPRPRVDLLLALPRPKVMKRLWAILASMGVGRIILTNAWKVERNYFDTHILQPSAIRSGLLEGLQQACDTRLPEVTLYRQLGACLQEEDKNFSAYTARLVAHPGAGQNMAATLAEVPPDARILLAIGSEGGWIPDEIRWLQEKGFSPVSMGNRILRSDVACISLLTLAHAALDGF